MPTEIYVSVGPFYRIYSWKFGT